MEHELTLAQKVKIVGTMTLISCVLLAVVAGGVSYQRNAKIEAAALAKTQIANAEKLKTDLPKFIDTVYGKNYLAVKGESNMVKVNQSSLPATITAGLDDSVSPNPACTPGTPGTWSISLYDGTGVANGASGETVDGWSVSLDGTVSIPATASYGKYKALYTDTDDCNPEVPGIYQTTYTYVFKIVPPCPTPGTLSVTQP